MIYSIQGVMLGGIDVSPNRQRPSTKVGGRIGCAPLSKSKRGGICVFETGMCIIYVAGLGQG